MKSLIYFLLLGVLLIGFSSCPDDDELIPMEEEEEMDPPVVDLMPNITFSAGPYYVGCFISLTASSVPGATFQINGSDGSSLTGAMHTLVFDAPGSYTFTVVATLNGRSEEQDRTITVVEQATFSTAYQEDGVYTRLYGLMAHPDGGFVSIGRYCALEVEQICTTVGLLVNWHDADGHVRTTRKFSSNGGRIARDFLIDDDDGDVVVLYQQLYHEDDDQREIGLIKIGETGSPDFERNLTQDTNFDPKSLIQTSWGNYMIGGDKYFNNQYSAEILEFNEATALVRTHGFGVQQVSLDVEALVQRGPSDIFGLMEYQGQVKLINMTAQSVADLGLIASNVVNLLARDNGNLVAVTHASSMLQLTIIQDNGFIQPTQRISVPDVRVYDAKPLANGNLLVSGRKGDSSSERVGYIAEVTLRGEILWSQELDRTGGTLRAINTTDDCGLLMVGYDLASSDHLDQAYIVKTKAEGEL